MFLFALLFGLISFSSYYAPRESWQRIYYPFKFNASNFEYSSGDLTIDAPNIRLNTFNLSRSSLGSAGWIDDNFTQGWGINGGSNVANHNESSNGDLYLTHVASTSAGIGGVNYYRMIPPIDPREYPCFAVRLSGTSNAKFNVNINTKDGAWHAILPDIHTKSGFTTYLVNLTQFFEKENTVKEGISNSDVIQAISLATLTSGPNQTVTNSWDFAGFFESVPNAGVCWNVYSQDLAYVLSFLTSNQARNTTIITFTIEVVFQRFLPYSYYVPWWGSYAKVLINDTLESYVENPQDLNGRFIIDVPLHLLSSPPFSIKMTMGPDLTAEISSIMVEVHVADNHNIENVIRISPWWKQNIQFVIILVLVELAIVAILYVKIKRPDHR